MRRVVLVLVLGGCDLVFHIDPIAPSTGDGGVTIDGTRAIDAAGCTGGVLVGLSGMNGAGLVQVCVTSTDAIHLPATINTDSPCAMAIAQPVGPGLCVFAGATIDAPVNVRVTGTRALVLAATGTITIAHTIDLSGKSTEPGAAGDTPNCGAQAGGNANGGGGGGGGGGGSFSTAGGPGNNSAGIGGNPSSLGNVSHVRGGCRGGAGGPTVDAPAGSAGHSGGAIYLASATKIVVTGGIDASGAGGGHGVAAATGSSGGGGGASGGLIAFDTPQLDASTGMIWANGGGGGGGGGAGPLRSDGVDGYPSSAPATAAMGGGGGDGGPTGGNGGAGGVFVAPGGPGQPSSNGAGAGGGAGGQGYVLFYGTAASVGIQNISPPLVKM
jgi:hypothetical protein